MKGLNKIMLIGNVGSDPEIRTTASGKKLAKLSLATHRTWKDGRGKEQERTNWHRCTLWGGLADLAENYIEKGDRLFVEGRVEYSETQGDDGHTRYWTDINVREVVMLGSGRESAQNGARAANAPAGGSTDPFGEDDDLPF